MRNVYREPIIISRIQPVLLGKITVSRTHGMRHCSRLEEALRRDEAARRSSISRPLMALEARLGYLENRGVMKAPKW